MEDLMQLPARLSVFVTKAFRAVQHPRLARLEGTRRVLTELRCSRSAVPTTPRTVDIELTNLCNQKCEFCPTGLGTIGRPKGKMSQTTFRNIIRFVSPEALLQFAGYGEPFLHDQQIETFLEMANSMGLRKIEVYSNFAVPTLREERIRHLLNHRFYRLIISLDAMDREAFRAYKGVDQFDETWENIRILADEAKIRGTTDHQLCVQMVVTRKNLDQVEAFRNYIASIGLIPVTKTLNTWIARAEPGKIADFEVPELSRYHTTPQYRRRCPWVWGGMLVFWNGDVTVCCEDPTGTSVHGNVNATPLSKLLNSGRAPFRHQYFADPGGIDMCRGCSLA